MLEIGPGRIGLVRGMEMEEIVAAGEKSIDKKGGNERKKGVNIGKGERLQMGWLWTLLLLLLLLLLFFCMISFLCILFCCILKLIELDVGRIDNGREAIA